MNQQNGEFAVREKPVENVLLGQKRYSGLRPYRKGEERARKSPGRPKYKDLVEQMRKTYCSNTKQSKAAMARLIKQLEKRKPDEIAHYLAGKPVTAFELSGPDSGQIEVHQTTGEDSVRALAAMGIFLPG